MSTWNERAADRLRRLREPNRNPPAPPRTGQRLVSFYDASRRRTSEGVDQFSILEAGGYTINGPVIANVAYVTHPVGEKRLIPFADFDETLAKDRLDEALRVFAGLGASRVVATANRVEVTRASAGSDAAGRD